MTDWTKVGTWVENWDVTQGGYQALAMAPFASFTGDKATAAGSSTPPTPPTGRPFSAMAK